MSNAPSGWYPAAVRKEITPGSNDGRIVPALEHIEQAHTIEGLRMGVMG